MGKDKDKQKDDESESGSGSCSGSESGSGDSDSDQGSGDRCSDRGAGKKEKKNKNKKNKDKKGKKGDKKGKKNPSQKSGKSGKSGKSSKTKMSTGKKVAIGVGIAALAIGVGVGGAYYLAKRRKKTAPAGTAGVGSRDIGSSQALSSSVQSGFGGDLQNMNSQRIKTSNDIISVPDLLTLGLGWKANHPVNLDLLAAVYLQNRTNGGYLQGSFNKSLFSDALTHTGDDQTGGVTSALGDNENIILDLRRVPMDVQVVTFGAVLVSGSAVGSGAYLHMLPLLREENIAGGREIQSEEEAGEWIEEGSSSGVQDEFMKLYHDDIAENPNFETQKGFVGGKIYRNPNSKSGWSFLPVRQAVPLNAQNGLWPALEHYALNT